jgi:hypothetical protein
MEGASVEWRGNKRSACEPTLPGMVTMIRTMIHGIRVSPVVGGDISPSREFSPPLSLHSHPTPPIHRLYYQLSLLSPPRQFFFFRFNYFNLAWTNRNASRHSRPTPLARAAADATAPPRSRPPPAPACLPTRARAGR